HQAGNDWPPLGRCVKQRHVVAHRRSMRDPALASWRGAAIGPRPSVALATQERRDVEVGLAVRRSRLEAAGLDRQGAAFRCSDLGRLALRRSGERRLLAELVGEALALLAVALDLGQDLAA